MDCCTPFFKGMVLAAGRGSRMGDLTQDVPKPLLPVKGQPLIKFSLRLLLHWGINLIVVNTWYLREKLVKYLVTIDLPMRIKISIEDTLLGTGGGVKKARSLLQDSPFFLINSDIITDFPLKELIIDPLPIATMVLVPYREGDTPVWLKNNKVTSIGEKGEGTPYTFGGIHLLTPGVFKYLPDGESSIINSFYIPAIQNGEYIRGVVWHGLWIDMGTRELYESNKIKVETGEIELPHYLLEDGKIS